MAIDVNPTAGFLSIQLDRSHLDRLVQGALSPQALKRAEMRAINETCAWLKGKLLQMLPSATGIPRKTLTRRVRLAKAKTGMGQGVSGKVWFGTRPIDAIYLKDEGPIGTGYMAGGFFFEGGFKATMPTGHKGIYARIPPKIPKKRQHIKTQEVDIDSQTQECVRRLIAPAQLALMQKMNRLVSFELERACR
jgi:hypothetical protein